MSGRGTPRSIQAALGAVALLFSASASARPEEPTPFWLGQDPADASPMVAPVPKPKQAQPPKKKKKPPAKRSRADDEAEAVLRGIDQGRKTLKQGRADERRPEPLIAPLPAERVREPARPADEDLLVPARPPREPPAPASALSVPAAVTPPSSTASVAAPRTFPASEVRPPVVARRSPTFDVTASGFVALWGSPSTVGGRQWDPVLGLRVATELPSAWSVEVYGARASTSEGNPYANTATTRLLFGARGGRWLYDQGGLIGLQIAGGLSASLSSTRYALRDVGGDAQAAEGRTGLKLAPELGGSLRLRPLKLVELRLDASMLYRDARLEALVGLSLGVWVAF